MLREKYDVLLKNLVANLQNKSATLLNSQFQINIRNYFTYSNNDNELRDAFQHLLKPFEQLQ